jgi:hypothetical protein
MKRTLTTCGLAFALAASLTTAAKADIVYTWVQGPNNPNLSGMIVGGAWLNPVSTSSGILTYDPTTQTIVSYLFTVTTGVVTIFNTIVAPPTPVSFILGDGDLHLSPVVGGPNSGNNVISSGLIGGGQWIDDVVFNPLDENYFEEANGGGGITGDWVPVSSVPEAGTVMAGALLLLPLGASTLRILRRNSMA